MAPMSEVAGRMSVQVGAHCLEKEQGGMGILLGGVPGVAAAKVAVAREAAARVEAAQVAAAKTAAAKVAEAAAVQAAAA